MNFGKKFSNSHRNSFRSFFVYNTKRNFSFFTSQPTLINFFNVIQKKTYSSLALSSTLMMSIGFLSNGCMTNSGPSLSVNTKQMRILELIEELALVGQSRLENSR